jgi:hypothetical protein
VNSFEAVFGLGAKNIAKHFTESGQRARTAVTTTLETMNKWASAGWSAIPYKKPIAITSAVGVGLAIALSEPAPAMNLSANFVQPQMQSGSGGQNVPQNVHPMPRAMGSPTAPNMVSSQNRAMFSAGHNVSISGRALGNSNPQALGNDLRNALGPNTQVDVRVTDQRRSLTAQSVSDILGSG